MNIVLLSGGSGKRLWPLSNDVRSKQFIKLFGGADGGYESMVQRMYRQIMETDPSARVTIATSRSQISAIHNQIGEDIGISLEPCRKDTFPAIVLAAAYLRDVKGASEDEAVVICPVDPYVEADYFKRLADVSRLAEEGKANITLMGVEPAYPSEKYGYIIPEGMEEVSPVSSFREKPDEATAKELMDRGALWNAGVFGFKLGYILERAENILGTSDYQELFNDYGNLQKISIDYAVVEKEPSIQVIRFGGAWKDLGTWNTLTEAMGESSIGNVMVSDSCENVHVVNELDVPVLAMGLKNIVISASPEGILVSDKHESSYIKPYVDTIDQQIMFAEKSWGEFKVLDVQPESMTLRVTLNPGHAMNYHSHDYRDEVWSFISGSGKVITDGEVQVVRAGDVVRIPAGTKHTVFARTKLQIMEIQLGLEINVSDKKKYTISDDWML